MKIHIENFQRLRQIDLSLDTPITLIAGHNEAGKTSLVDALRLTLLQESERAPKKKDWSMLVNDLAQKGAIEISGDGWSTRITLPAGAVKTTGKPPRGPALVSSLSPSAIGGLRAADDRRAFFCAVLGVRSDRASIQARLVENDCDPALVSEMVGDGWDEMSNFAAARASEARGAWRQITGEVYGPEKAATWKPAVPADQEGDDRVTEAQLQKCEKIADEAQRRVGALESTQQTYERLAGQMTEAASIAATYSRHYDALAQAEKDLAEARASIELWRGRLETALSWPCPSCGSTLCLEGGSLIEHDLSAGAKFPEAASKVAQFEDAAQMLARSVANRKRDLDAADSAAKTLESLRTAGAGEPAQQSDIDAARETLALAQDRLRSMRKAWQKEQANQVERESAARRQASAAAAHSACARWTHIAASCGSAGLPARDLAAAVSRINDRLAHTARLAGWRSVLLRDDMEILIGGRLYALCSESARWRADALLAEAAAHLSGLHFLVFDRVDVLDAPGRIQLFRLLHLLHNEGEVRKCLLLGTFKEPPSKMPSTICVHWLAEGELVPYLEKQEAA